MFSIHTWYVPDQTVAAGNGKERKLYSTLRLDDKTHIGCSMLLLGKQGMSANNARNSNCNIPSRPSA